MFPACAGTNLCAAREFGSCNIAKYVWEGWQLSDEAGCSGHDPLPQEQVLEFWGKSRRDECDSSGEADCSPPFKPVLHHLFDVAAVAEAWQAACPSRCIRDGQALNVPPRGSRG